MVLPLRGGGDSRPPQDMALAAGGRIIQKIYPDTSAADRWDTTKAVFFNVQILNTEVFTKITGLKAPDTPITQRTYREYGYPYYKLWNEPAASGVSGNFSSIKTVNDIDKTKQDKEARAATMDVVSGNDNSVTLLDAKAIGRPFRHISQLEASVRALHIADL